MILSSKQIIFEIRLWIERMVLGLNLCPFAHLPFREDRIQFLISKAKKEEQLDEALLQACETLIQTNSQTIETILLIHPYILEDFDNYCEYLAKANNLLFEHGFEGQLQIASFHPNYCFQNNHYKDPANFTNRSPYPMLHILREDSVANAIENHRDVHAIPNQNILKLRELGTEQILKLLGI